MFFCLLWKGPIFEPKKILHNKRPYVGILFLVFVLFRPCSSYLFPFSTYVVLLAAFLIFLDHILQNSCRLFGLFSSFFYFSGLACFVVFSYQVRFVAFLALPWLIAVDLVFLCLTVWPHNMYLSRMNQHGHWVYWCRWVERTVECDNTHNIMAGKIYFLQHQPRM